MDVTFDRIVVDVCNTGSDSLCPDFRSASIRRSEQMADVRYSIITLRFTSIRTSAAFTAEMKRNGLTVSLTLVCPSRYIGRPLTKVIIIFIGEFQIDHSFKFAQGPQIRSLDQLMNMIVHLAQAKHGHAVPFCVGTENREINQTILETVKQYRSFQRTLIDVIRHPRQKPSTLHNLPLLKINFGLQLKFGCQALSSVGHKPC